MGGQLSFTNQSGPSILYAGHTPDVPAVVLPDPDTCDWQQPPAPEVQALASDAASALGGVRVFDAPPDREASLARASATLQTLYDHIAGDDSPTPGESVEPLTPIHTYFGLRRATLTRQQAAPPVIRTLAHGVADLRLAALAGSDLERSCAAMQMVIHDLFALAHAPTRGGPAPEPSAAGNAPSPGQGRASDPEGMWHARWLIGHHLHAVFNVWAAIAVEQAVTQIRAGRPRAAVTHLKRATVYIEGFPAARAQSLAVPADFYNAVLRPSMLPPLVPAPLSGSMHIEYQRYQAGIDAFLSACPEPVDVLAPQHLTLALAREALLEADLIDAARHVCMVEPLVGAAKSLTQHARTKDNAMSVLRRIHDRRAARYAPFLRFSFHQEGSPA